MRAYKDRKEEVHLDPAFGPQGIVGRRNITVFVHDGPNSMKEKTKHGPLKEIIEDHALEHLHTPINGRTSA
jgi:hypothetical protein